MTDVKLARLNVVNYLFRLQYLPCVVLCVTHVRFHYCRLITFVMLIEAFVIKAKDKLYVYIFTPFSSFHR